jgi:hypothetical protein
MCDSAAPGTRTGSARDIASHLRPTGRARASVPGQFRAGGSGPHSHLRSHTAITGKIGRARLSTLVAGVHDTALLIASLPGSPIVGMGSPVSRARGSHLPRPAATGTSLRTSDQGSGDQRAAHFSKNASMPSW